VFPLPQDASNPTTKIAIAIFLISFFVFQKYISSFKTKVLDFNKKNLIYNENL
jgi:hypothetical protein